MRWIRFAQVPVGLPEDHPDNPRLHDDEWLDESAEVNGQYRSVVVRGLPSPPDRERPQILPYTDDDRYHELLSHQHADLVAWHEAP